MPETVQLDSQQLEKIGKVDVVVAIPSYNHAATIGSVAEAAYSALRRNFSGWSAAVVNADGGSRDETVERFLSVPHNGTQVAQFSYPVYPGHIVSPLPTEIPGRVSALQQILSVSRAAEAKACVLIDASAPGVAGECIERLAGPVLDSGFDLVAPRYPRPPFHGMLINGVVYPMIRALYGKQLWQPVESDLGLSGRLIEHYLNQPAWQNDSVSSSVDLWLSTEAACSGYRIGQAFLGSKNTVAKDAAPHLEELVAAVAGSVFAQMERTVSCWQRVRGSTPVPCFGERVEAEGEAAALNPQRMREGFRLGYQNLYEIWSTVLSPASLLELKKLALSKQETFVFSDALWVRAVYDFALGYHFRVMNREHLLRALTPLYLGWLASLALEMSDATCARLEARTEQLCLAFEAQKPQLISRWRWPDRFNP